MSRGEYGSGTVSQIKTGKGAGNWRAYLTVDGKRRTFFAKTEDEVKAKLLDARHAVRHHAPVAPPRVVSVGTYVQEWLTDQRDHLRPSSWAGYDSNVRNHILPSLAHVKLADLQPTDVRRLHRESKARGAWGRAPCATCT